MITTNICSTYVNNIFPTYAQRTVKNSTYVIGNLYWEYMLQFYLCNCLNVAFWYFPIFTFSLSPKTKLQLVQFSTCLWGCYFVYLLSSWLRKWSCNFLECPRKCKNWAITNSTNSTIHAFNLIQTWFIDIQMNWVASTTYINPLTIWFFNKSMKVSSKKYNSP